MFFFLKQLFNEAYLLLLKVIGAQDNMYKIVFL